MKLYELAEKYSIEKEKIFHLEDLLQDSQMVECCIIIARKFLKEPKTIALALNKLDPFYGKKKSREKWENKQKQKKNIEVDMYYLKGEENAEIMNGDKNNSLISMNGNIHWINNTCLIIEKNKILALYKPLMDSHFAKEDER